MLGYSRLDASLNKRISRHVTVGLEVLWSSACKTVSHEGTDIEAEALAIGNEGSSR